MPDTATVTLGILLTFSEFMPFISQISGNGLLHTLADYFNSKAESNNNTILPMYQLPCKCNIPAPEPVVQKQAELPRTIVLTEK